MSGKKPVKPKPERGSKGVKPNGKPIIGNESTQFKKGQSGNPLGARLHDPEIKKLRQLTQNELKKVANMVVFGDYQELMKIAKSPKGSVLQVMLASVVTRIIAKGDMSA